MRSRERGGALRDVGGEHRLVGHLSPECAASAVARAFGAQRMERRGKRIDNWAELRYPPRGSVASEQHCPRAPPSSSGGSPPPPLFHSFSPSSFHSFHSPPPPFIRVPGGGGYPLGTDVERCPAVNSVDEGGW